MDFYKFYHMLTRTDSKKRKLQNKGQVVQLLRSIDDKSYLLQLKPGYIMQPSAAEVFQRNFIIHNFTIQNKSTLIYWRGITDLRKLKAPLSQLVDLGQTYVEVYPNDKLKPMAGLELNKTCFVTFSRFRHINKRKLKEICCQNQCQILAIDKQNRQFTVQIPHFTKYQFDGAEIKSDDQQEQQIKLSQIVNKPQNIPAGSLASNLKIIHSQNLSKQKQAIRAGSIGFPIQIKKDVLPTPKLQQQVSRYNSKNGHIIQGNRIRGTAQTFGVNCRVHSQIYSQDRHDIIISKPAQTKNDKLLSVALQIAKDSNKQIDYILSPATPFQVKRALALNIICFEFENCYFQFQKTEQKLNLVKIQHPPQQYYRKQYFKNWFQWVLNQDQKLQKIQDPLIKALVLRKGNQLAQQYLKYNQTDDAEFLSSIQDETYRCTEVPRGASKILKALSLGDMSHFDRFSWFVKLAVFVWYYSFKEFSNLSFDKFLDQKIVNQPDYNIQRHILRVFKQKQFLIDNLTYVSESQSPLWWLILNRNDATEKRLNNKPQYVSYRYNLLHSMVQSFANSQIALQLVSHQKLLQKPQKLRILANFIKKYPLEAGITPIQNWKEYADLVNQNKALTYFGNDQYFNSLSYFSKCKSLSEYGRAALLQLVHRQQIIYSFHTKTLARCLIYLQQIQKSLGNNINLSSQILFINTALGNQNLDKQNMLKLIQLCYNIQIIKLRKRMLDAIFHQGLKSRIIRSELKKDEKVKLDKEKNKIPIGSSQKMTFYELMKSYYKDPSYILQLKFARLQV